ncbi:ribonucleoside-triphosphate reductase (formate) [Alphaproteobacteria bacterium]
MNPASNPPPFDSNPTLKSTHKYIIKRDDSKNAFDPSKIVSAIYNAGNETKEFGIDEAHLLSAQVLKVLKHKFHNKAPHVEQVQDVIEHTLIAANYLKTARAYIVYREQHQRLREDRKTLLNVVESVNEYLDQLDWRVKANANQGYSLGGLILNLSGKVIANYWLKHVYSSPISEAHCSGDFHIHDLDMLCGYCAGWSLKMLLTEGFNGVKCKADARPPRHLSSALGQIVNFFGTLQNEWAGAQAFSSFDTYLAPFIRCDSLTYEEVKQQMQEFIYNMNIPSRWGTQTPFTNLTFDLVCPEDLRDKIPLIGGEEMPFTYGDLQKEIDLINRAYIEVMLSGDAKGRIFTFPLPTYNITKDFLWDHPNTDLLFEMTAKYGSPYFQNFVNSELEPGMVRSMCCRLQLDLRELLKRGNGLFGSAEQTGSIGVVTLNCARIGYLFKDNEAGLYKRTDTLLELAKKSLEDKRKVIKRFLNAELFPYTKRYLGTFRNHFSTIGVSGINEMIRNFTNNRLSIVDDEGHQMACHFLEHIRGKLVQIQEETGHMYNLEATPAEGATYRFAKEDLQRFPDIIQAGTPQAPYYTNSSQLPVGYTDDPFVALAHQEELQKKYTGGTVMHLYMSERISSAQSCKTLVRRVVERFRIPYFSITPTFSICPKHGYLAGEHHFCPLCDEEILVRKRAHNSLSS